MFSKKTRNILAHNPNWKTEFEQLRNRLTAILPNIECNIEHIGSTAIADLFAKPILDIDIIIENKELLPYITDKLQDTGYIYKGEQGITGRFAFRQQTPSTPYTVNQQHWMEHHLYVCFSDSLALKNHLLVKNSLLNNPILVENYGNLKKQLIRKNISKEAYTKQKTNFILDILLKEGLTSDEIEQIRRANE